MKKRRHLYVLLPVLVVAGCLNSAESATALGGQRSKSSGRQVQTMNQVIELAGEKIAEITETGEVWIGGEKAGEITKSGEIWVAGSKEGELTKDGEVWKNGEKVGDITSRGEVWKDGNEVGTVESDGTIWVGSSREGTFSGGDPKTAALLVFYGFFNFEG